MRHAGIGIFVALAVHLAAGCRNPAAPLPATLVFSTTPIDEANIDFVVPIGNLNPPGHTVPSDHTYFYHPSTALQVVAPAGGVIKMIRHDADDVIRIQATDTMTYYMAHLVLDAGIAEGETVSAGDRLGVTSMLAFAMDLGLINSDLTLFFVTPARYPTDTLHSDSPFKYFSEPLRSRVYAKEQGTGGDGKIDFDQTGKLAGNWFLEGLPIANSTSVDAGPKLLAFVRDVDRPSQVRVSIGGTLSMPGVWAIASAAPDPATITPGSGRVSYQLEHSQDTAQVGVMLVQMLDGAKIKVETFPGGSVAPSDFTGAASIYVR